MMRLLLISSSTRGPNQLRFLLKDLHIEDTRVMTTQHMSSNCLSSFVNKLNEESINEVRPLEGKELLSHKIYIRAKNTMLAGNFSLMVLWRDVRSSSKPSVDSLLRSAVELVKTDKILAVILTGMGNDGAKGLLELHKAGVRCLCENEVDSVAYGMPKRAKDLNPNLRPMSLKGIKSEITRFIEED